MNEFLNFCNLNNFEYWLVIRLYFAAIFPIFLTIYYFFRGNISYSKAYTLISSFFIVALGWEIWMTYGLAGGLPVDERRSVMLTCAIPVNINWLLNSLADVLIVWIGLFFVKTYYKNKKSPFIKWEWGAFFILLIWFIVQNIYVEAFFYHLQLGSNGDLSWAPLQPLGSWYNPTLFKILGNPITFQTQSCWIIITPIIYYLSIYFNRIQKDF
ncbi:MAG: hypothetical protein CMC38_06785 [Flavobacteriaceae bacterium]|nr:hypothetical protein [Flavobacteriaceae bacterium]|tara:strand:+ start:2353 stop:2988 length:636 start_codon:yes stop_codon:yes gene_type:complete